MLNVETSKFLCGDVTYSIWISVQRESKDNHLPSKLHSDETIDLGDNYCELDLTQFLGKCLRETLDNQRLYVNREICRKLRKLAAF